MDISEYLARVLNCRPRAAAPPGSWWPIIRPARCSTGRKSCVSRKNCFPSSGFVAKDVPEGHLCCGSAGTYNILQPELARRLRDRKVGNIEKLTPDVIAAGNIGCITQIARAPTSRSFTRSS